MIIAIWKTHNKYCSALIKVITGLAQAQHTEKPNVSFVLCENMTEGWLLREVMWIKSKI